MAINSNFYIISSSRAYLATKPIPTKEHMSVWLKLVDDMVTPEPDLWIQLDVTTYDLINNSAVLKKSVILDNYTDIEIRVGDSPDELLNSPSAITIVAGISDQIITVANIADEIIAVNLIANEIAAVGSDPLKSAILDVTTEPLRQSILDAEQNADDAEAAWDDFQSRYYGTAATDPLTDPLGNPPTEGDLYFNTTSPKTMKVYTGSVWTAAGSAVNGLITHDDFIATAGQTLFTGLTYDVGSVTCYRNGYRLPSSAFTATDGTTLTLTTAAALGDDITIEAFGAFDSGELADILADIDQLQLDMTQAQLDIIANATSNGIQDGKIVSLEDDRDDLIAFMHGVDNPDSAIITLNADPTKYDITGFDHWIKGVKYNYAGSIGNAGGFVSTGDFIDIGITSAGIVTKLNDFFTPVELETTLELGRIASADGANITSIGDSVFFEDEFMKNLYIRFKSYEGSLFFNGTGRATENATPLRIDIEGGNLSTANMQTQVVPSESAVDGFPIYAISGTTAIRTEETPLIAQNTQYDDGTDLATIPTGQYVTHTLFRSNGTTKYYLQYGRETFKLLNEAIEVEPVNTLFDIQGSEVEELAKIVVQEGTANIVQIVDIRDGRFELVGDIATQEEIVEFFGESTAITQEPVGLDTALQVEFGIAQAGDNATLSAAGAITIIETGEYHINTTMHFGRDGGAGQAEVFLRKLVNGVQQGSVKHVTLDNANFVFPVIEFEKNYLLAGDIVTYEIIKDSIGVNEGGLFAANPNTAGWNDSPTASITVIKHRG